MNYYGGTVTIRNDINCWVWTCNFCGEYYHFDVFLHPIEAGPMGCRAISSLPNDTVFRHHHNCFGLNWGQLMGSGHGDFNRMMTALEQQVAIQASNAAYQQMKQLNSGGLNYGAWGTNPQIHGNSNGTNNSAWGPGASSNSPNTPKFTLTAAQAALFSSAAHVARGKPIESAGIRIGEILAYRIWQISKGYLQAYSSGRIWAPGEVMTGNVEDHGFEGIWAFKEKSRAIKKMMGGEYVFGSVKLWGKVIEYALGYRAECAKIVSIDDFSGLTNSPIDNKTNKAILQGLKKKYGMAA